MKQKLLIFLTLILLVLLLVGLNAATYVQKEKVPDTEFAPNRSTFNSGATGSQAFYALLAETGRKVTRWQESLETINSETKNRPAVFVMIGPRRRELTSAENTQLMEWVSTGGTLILIDRDPPAELTMTTAQWQIAASPRVDPDIYTVDASDQKQMTAGTVAMKPMLPSYFSHGVIAVQPSRFATPISLERFKDAPSLADQTPSPTPYDFFSEDEPSPPASEDEADPHQGSDEDTEAPAELVDRSPSLEAPLAHLAGANGNVLIEAPFAQGRVIILSDPYIVSNAGINIVDNSRLAVNLVTSREGLIAFDEYHHGFGSNNNRVFQYFEGTPVIAIFLQLGLLAALVFFSQSRRFARPVPEVEPSRLSKLEYVSAMAELQQRTRAYDLAIENIYSDFRRRVSSLLGLDNTTATRHELADRISQRTGGAARVIEELMFKCEDIIHGEDVGKSETLKLIEEIRKLEEQLGLRRAASRGV